MSRRVIPLLVLLNTFVGISCKKKPDVIIETDDPNEYTIKLRKFEKGMVASEKRNKSGKLKAIVTFEKGGANKENSDSTSKTLSSTTTILERSQDAKKPTKFQIVYDQYKEKAIGKAEVNSSIVGQKIVGEMKDGKYQFASDGKLTSADVDFLERHYRKIDSVTVEDKLPKKPVKVKETWDVDRAVTLKAFEEFGDLPPADRDRVMEKGKLLKAYKKDDRQYGVLEFTIEIPFKSGQQYKGAVLQDGSKVTATLTIDCCIDGSILDEQLTIELKMLLNLKVPNATVINEYVELDESRQIEVTK